jgi:hypothetical protein
MHLFLTPEPLLAFLGQFRFPGGDFRTLSGIPALFAIFDRNLSSLRRTDGHQLGDKVFLRGVR